MSFQKIVGQERVKRFLQGNLKTGAVAHGYLFSGSKGSGKLALARALAQAIYCEQQSIDACGQCVSCRKFLHGNMTVYKEIGLLPGKTRIVLEQLVDLKKNLHFRAEDQYKKIYVIQDAHLLKDNSAAAMLKYLEEPGADQLAILLTHNELELPTTILSRLQIVRFAPPNPEQLISQLHALETTDQRDPELQKLAVYLSGNVEQAERWLKTEWFAEYRNLVVELMQCAVQNRLRAVSILQQRFTKFKADWKRQLDLLAQMMELLVRDIVFHAVGRSADVVFVAQHDWLGKVALDHPLDFWLNCAERAVALRAKRNVNANWHMLLEHYFIHMK